MRQLIGQPYIFDGAMGTYYASRAANPVSPCELANLYDPGTIVNIHREYIAAGCQAIKTNTFAANRISLNSDFETVREIICLGYRLAEEAVRGTQVQVFADIGPIPGDDNIDIGAQYQEIVNVFLNLGASHFIFETFSSADYLLEMSQFIKGQNPQAYILAEFAVSPEGLTRMGLSGRQLLEKVWRCPSIDACGFNCYSGPSHLLEYIKTFDIGDKTISVMPNSGYPATVNNRIYFDNSKEYFAAKMLELAQQGVAILGGCCGTTPAYIRETVDRLKGLTVEEIAPKVTQPQALRISIPLENPLLNKIQQGEKVLAVELDPPIDTDIAFFMEGARLLKHAGVDAITIADCPLARARVDSSLMACKLKRELDITPIPHLTCRDRNINATKALLLGLSIEGVNNVLVVTGDPVPTAQRDEIKGIFSFNSAVLAGYIRNLNETVFSSPFNICAALNVNAKNFGSQLQRAQKKIAQGVTMFLTQPVLSRQAAENIKTAREELNASILGGILPIMSHRNACFMNNEVAGIYVAEEIINKYRDIPREKAHQLAVRLSIAIASQIYDYVDGYYLITPFKRVDIITAIIAGIRKNMGTGASFFDPDA